MDFRIENSNSHAKDFQPVGYWIPATPAKPGSSPICADRQEKQSNFTALAANSYESPQDMSFRNSLSACTASTSRDENLTENLQYLAAKSQLTGGNDDVSIYTNFSTDNVDKCNMTFQDLLALADAAVTKTVAGDENGSNSVIHEEGGIPINLGCENYYSLQGGFQIMGYSTSNMQQGVQHNPSHHTFDLNSAPETSEVDFFMSNPTHFAPETPDPTRRLENRQISDLLRSITDEGTNPSNEMLNIENAPERVVEKNCTNLKEHTQLFQEQSGDAVSIQLQENFNSDKGANEDANLNRTPQQKPRRRKHRPKVVIEGQPKRTNKPKIPKPDTPIGASTGKRKYVRRKGVETPSATPAAEPKETNDLKTVRETRKSCRRSINFDTDSQTNEERTSLTYEETLRTGFQPTVQLKQGMERTVENRDTVTAYELIQQTNQVLESYLSLPEKQASNPLTPNKKDLPRTRSANNAQSVASRKGKCRIHFSDDTHDKDRYGVRSLNDSNCSTSESMNNEEQARAEKRQRSGKISEMEMCTFNSIGAQYNSCQAYQSMFLDYGANFPAMHFPVIYKKKRTEKGQHSTTSSIQSSMPSGRGHSRDMATRNFSLASGWKFANDQFNASNVSELSTASGTQGEQQSFNSMLAFDHTIKFKKKRTKGLTRGRDLASFAGILACKQWPAPGRTASGVMQEFGATHSDLVADIRLKLAKRKRTKRNSSGPSMPFDPLYHHQSTFNSSGFVPRLIWKSMNPVDALIKQFEHLDINGQSSEVVNQEQHALIPYYTRYQEKNALVVYQRDGTLVPFDESFNQVRRRKPRPKVDLDDETTRVWKLLLEDINSQGVDGTDEEKAKWWEEERRVFRGRADSFIARMHLVQGDRRFSRWKGSVVDSVVGVFLTQNVSDHLSSSAFMSLAARFPLKSTRGPASGAETSMSVREPEIPEVDLDETIRWHEGKSNQTANELSSVMLQDPKYCEEIEAVNSNEFSRSSTNIITSKDKLDCEALDMCGSDLTKYHESLVDRSGAQVSELAASLEMDDVLSSQNYAVSSQNSVDSSIVQASEIIVSCSRSDSGAQLAAGSETVHCGSTENQLQMQGNILHEVYKREGVDGSSNKIEQYKFTDNVNSDVQNQAISTSCRSTSPNNYNLHLSDSGFPMSNYFDLLEEDNTVSRVHRNYREKCASEQSELSAESASQATVQVIMTTSSPGEVKSCNLHEATETCSQSIDQSPKDNINQHTQKDACRVQQVFDVSIFSGENSDVTESASMVDQLREKEHNASLNGQGSIQIKVDGMNEGTSKTKRVRTGKAKQNAVEWDSLRQQARNNDGKTRGNTPNTMDSLDYEAVRCADVDEIADTIKERGMNNMLAERIKDFLNRLVRDHGSIDLEWLRDVPPDKAKEYLLSFRGLGLKSVECVRLLTLHHLAFPVDTNVGRIAVRLGWVPLQPLPESLQLHLLELYPVQETIQKYLWPRLCKLDQRTLYELHYQMITFGKVFCTKSKPNCNACPMRGECRHFASAFASARLTLPAPEEKRIVISTESKASDESPTGIINEQKHLPAPPPPPPPSDLQLEATNYKAVIEVPATPGPIIKVPATPGPIIEVPATPGPIIEVPTTPEQDHIETQEIDIEDGFGEDPDEIPTIKLNIEEFTQNLQNYMETNMELQDGEMSRALVALTQEAASIPTPKLKNMSRLRTEHQVYELPDSHPLLKGLDERERDDPCPYLLAIWTPGETADSVQPPGQCSSQCSSEGLGRLCDKETCFSCNSVREANAQTVRGTLLIPCRTAMRGSFPLNGTYFQVNEVFADHDSSLNPIDVPRSWLWNLPRRTVYFGTSIPTIFKGLTTEGIQYCFWRGFVCVRGFDQTTRAPRPLMARLHFPASKQRERWMRDRE